MSAAASPAAAASPPPPPLDYRNSFGISVFGILSAATGSESRNQVTKVINALRQLQQAAPYRQVIWHESTTPVNIAQSLNRVNSDGNTIFHRIAASPGANIQVVTELSRIPGIQKHIQDRNGRTPYDIAITSGNTALANVIGQPGAGAGEGTSGGRKRKSGRKSRKGGRNSKRVTRRR